MEKIVIVKTNQPKTEILEEGDILKVALKSKPEDGKANKELINFLSKKYKLKVEIIKGRKRKKKVIRLIPPN